MLSYCKHLPLEMRTIEYVIKELIVPEQQEAIRLLAEEGTLAVAYQSDKNNDEIFELFTSNKDKVNLSIADCAVIVYAQHHECAILTGDRKMRSFAEAQGLEVAGVFYLVDLFVEEGIITPNEMVNHLRLLAQSNARLPRFAIDERIKKYTTQTNSK